MSLGRLAAIFLAALAVIVILVLPLSAEIYRWVDENGVTHFSDRKPGGVDEGAAETVDPSKSGSLSVVEEGDNKYSPTTFIKELLSQGTGSDSTRNNTVQIYTTPT